MVTKNKVASGKQVIVIDQREEQKSREQHLKIFNVSKTLRDMGNQNLYRTVQAILDPVSVRLFGLDINKDTNKAVCEVYFPNKSESELTDEYCNTIINSTVASMVKNGYKVLRSVLYRDPNNQSNIVGKILVLVS